MRTSWLVPLALVLAACSTSTTPAQGPVGPATTGTATSAAPAPSSSASESPFDCERQVDENDPEKWQEWIENCEQTIDEPADPDEMPEPASFSETYRGEGVLTEVTKITHPDKSTVAFRVKVTNQGNIIPPEVQIDPSAILAYATKKDEKLRWGEDEISLTYSEEAEETGGLDDFDKRGRDLEPKKTLTVPLKFEVPAKYQGNVVLNFAINEDHKWAFFAGSIR